MSTNMRNLPTERWTHSILATGIVAVALLGMSGCDKSAAPAASESSASESGAESPAPAVHYIEIVTPDVDALCALYGEVHGLEFGSPDADLGQARVAERKDGTLLGVRAPLADHESPIVRTYAAVDDIEAAVKAAEAKGATVAYPPTEQGKRGTFAIVIIGGIQYGFWQR